MGRLRDDPGFWWNVRWFTHGIRWFLLLAMLGMITFMVWNVVAGW